MIDTAKIARLLKFHIIEVLEPGKDKVQETISELLCPHKPGLALLGHHFIRVLQDYANFY